MSENENNIDNTNDIIDAEVVDNIDNIENETTEIAEIGKVITLPEIINSIPAIAANVSLRIANLNLSDIEVTEENKKKLKNLRTKLGDELKKYEQTRINIKKDIMTPYENFESVYNEKIKKLYKDADSDLKKAIDELAEKEKQRDIDIAKKYYDELSLNYNIKEASFDKVVINYTNPKQIRLSIETYFKDLKDDLELIKTYGENESRLYVIWTDNGNDIKAAQITLNRMIERERQIEEAKARESAKPVVPTPVAPAPVIEQPKVVKVEPTPVVDEVSDYTLTVTCTETELAELMEYLLTSGLIYELN